MTITAISRDYGINPSIVRLVTTDSIENIILPGWLLLQKDDIEEVNNGGFDWNPNDSILLSYSADNDIVQNALFSISPDLITVKPITPIYPNQLGIVAKAGGGQNSTATLIRGINEVNTVVSPGDSVTLPDDVLGQTVIIHNVSSNSMNVFPFLGDSINSLSTNASIALAAGSRMLLFGADVKKWITLVSP